MRHLILADKPYAGAKGEGENLVRPFKRCEKAYKEDPLRAKAFNLDVSKAWVKVDHVFARLKSWRALQGLSAWNAKRYDEIVKAVSVLHNLNLGFA